jgi:hypothetical protein
VSRAEKGLRLLPGASLAQIDRHWPTASASPRLSTASVSISKRMIRSWHNAISSNSSQSIWTGSVPECHHTYVSGYSNTTVQPSDGFGALLRRFGAGRPNSRAAVIKNDGVPGPIVIATVPGKVQPWTRSHTLRAFLRMPIKQSQISQRGLETWAASHRARRLTDYLSTP